MICWRGGFTTSHVKNCALAADILRKSGRARQTTKHTRSLFCRALAEVVVVVVIIVIVAVVIVAVVIVIVVVVVHVFLTGTPRAQL